VCVCGCVCVSMQPDLLVRLCRPPGPELSDTPAANWTRVLDDFRISFPSPSGDSRTSDCRKEKEGIMFTKLNGKIKPGGATIVKFCPDTNV